MDVASRTRASGLGVIPHMLLGDTRQVFPTVPGCAGDLSGDAGQAEAEAVVVGGNLLVKGH